MWFACVISCVVSCVVSYVIALCDVVSCVARLWCRVDCVVCCVCMFGPEVWGGGGREGEEVREGGMEGGRGRSKLVIIGASAVHT